MSYDVGGIRQDRPFKIRRLGHSGFNVENLDAVTDFYLNNLGLRQTDLLDLKVIPNLPPVLAGMEDSRVIFTTYGADHHAVVLAHKSLDILGDADRASGVTLNQITWQVSSLEELIGAEAYLTRQGVHVARMGRDMPGSNWHIYFKSPDGHSNELYYGIEQIGWDRQSKPSAMYYRRFDERPSIPQMSERVELEEAIAKGIGVGSGYRPPVAAEYPFDVGGVFLAQPFKVTRLGPIGLFVPDIEEAVRFYRDILGLTLTEEIEYLGQRCVFLRAGTEHHSLALFPLALRESSEFSKHTRCMTFGLQLGNYLQLKNAVTYFKSRNCRFIDVPKELYPGIDFAAHIVDPDGHCIQLFYYMEQIGWDGRPRPPHLRRKIALPWPDQIEALSDTFADQPFLGPLD